MDARTFFAKKSGGASEPGQGGAEVVAGEVLREGPEAVSALTVYLNAEKLGDLEQDAGGMLRFTYDTAWLKKPNAVPISRSLPLQAETFTGKETRPEREIRVLRAVSTALALSLESIFYPGLNKASGRTSGDPGHFRSNRIVTENVKICPKFGELSERF